MAVVWLVPLVLRLRDRKSGQNTKAGPRAEGAPRVRFPFVSPAFPLISLFNELERLLGTHSLPRDPGSLEPEHRAAGARKGALERGISLGRREPSHP